LGSIGSECSLHHGSILFAQCVHKFTDLQHNYVICVCNCVESIIVEGIQDYVPKKGW